MSDTNEVGCQIILTTGEHIGECKGTCHGPQASDFSDTTHDEPLLARIAALEAQVRELEARHNPLSPEHRQALRERVANADNAEVGCQIILTTGKHIGECKGTCHGPQASDFSDTTHDEPLLARLDALDAQVRELRRQRDETFGWLLEDGPPMFDADGEMKAMKATPKATAGNAPSRPLEDDEVFHDGVIWQLDPELVKALKRG